MTKHFVMTDSNSVSILFVENGITIDVLTVKEQDLSEDTVLYCQSGIPYQLSDEDIRRIIVEQIMFLMRSERFVPQNIKKLS